MELADRILHLYTGISTLLLLSSLDLPSLLRGSSRRLPLCATGYVPVGLADGSGTNMKILGLEGSRKLLEETSAGVSVYLLSSAEFC